MKEENNNVYLAIPKAVIKSGEISAYSNENRKVYNTLVSEPLGFFLVKPIKRLKIYRSNYDGSILTLATVGFAEVKTGKRIITRTFRHDNNGNTEAIQHDVLATTTPNVGDVEWSVEYQPTALEQLDKEKLQEYMNLSKKEKCER